MIGFRSKLCQEMLLELENTGLLESPVFYYKAYKKDKIMDIVTLECPNCGVEVCFDEIKGEAAKGQIDDLKDSVERYRQICRIFV